MSLEGFGGLANSRPRSTCDLEGEQGPECWVGLDANQVGGRLSTDVVVSGGRMHCRVWLSLEGGPRSGHSLGETGQGLLDGGGRVLE